MMRKIALFSVVVLMMLASCSSVEKTATITKIETNVIQNPTIADLDVRMEKVEKTVSWGIEIFNRIPFNTRLENLVAEILKENDADVLVEPHFIYQIDGGIKTLTVFGFPAKFNTFRNATESDLEILKYSSSSDSNKDNSTSYKISNGFGNIIKRMSRRF